MKWVFINFQCLPHSGSPPIYSSAWAHGLPLPGQGGDLGIDVAEPTFGEVVLAVKGLNNNKAPGANGVTAELLKFGGEAGLLFVHEYILRTWRSGKAPEDWKRAQIVILHKSGSRANLDNYRGISLLDIIGKVYTRVLLGRLQAAMDSRLHEAQMGFRPGRSCSDALFTINQLTNWSREFQQPLFACFVDLKKAYDCVNRDALWYVLGRQGVPAKLVELLRDLHTGSSATIKAFGGESRPFEIRGGVRQGCNIAPLLFNIFLDFVVQQASAQFECAGRRSGVRLSFNWQGQPFKTDFGCLSELEIISILLYADDMAILADDEGELEHCIQVLEAVTQRWGLTINVKKTKLWKGDWRVSGGIQPGNDSTPAPIIIRGEAIEEVQDFKYLGSTLTTSGELEKELSRRWALATGKFAQLEPIWSNSQISLRTKMLFYKACIPSTLLYGCESWALTQAQAGKLNAIHMRFLRQLSGVKWWQKLSNVEVAARCDIEQIPAMLSKTRMRWVGHMIRMGNTRLPKKILFGGLARAGARGRGRPKQRVATLYEQDICDMATAGLVSVSGRKTRAAGPAWWILAQNKTLWGVCIDKRWPRRPPAQTLPVAAEIGKDRPRPSYV
jgi:hypothetical protein